MTEPSKEQVELIVKGAHEYAPNGPIDDRHTIHNFSTVMGHFINGAEFGLSLRDAELKARDERIAYFESNPTHKLLSEMKSENEALKEECNRISRDFISIHEENFKLKEKLAKAVQLLDDAQIEISSAVECDCTSANHVNGLMNDIKCFACGLKDEIYAFKSDGENKGAV